MPTLQANGITIGYDLLGDGPPLVLIAGLGYDRWMWHKMVPLLAPNHCVLVYDNRGVGESDKPAGAYSADLLAADLAALMDALAIPAAAIMGHSMGGFVAQAFALAYPQRVTHLILSATNFGGPNHVPVTQEALAVLTDTSTDPITRLRRGIEISTAAGFSAANPGLIDAWVAFRAAHPIDLTGYQGQLAIGIGLLAPAAAFEGRLHQLRMPTLILSGNEDKVVPPGNAPLLAAEIEHSTVKILDGVGHFYPFEAPAPAAGLVSAFLKGAH